MQIIGEKNPTERIEVKDVESFRVAALMVKASRSEAEKYFKRLFTWLKQRGLESRKKLAIFYDKVYEGDSSKVIRYEVCFEIKETVEEEGGVRIIELPRQKVATLSHQGPCKKIPSTYKTLLEWIKNEGYMIEGPPREVYVVPSNLEDENESNGCAVEIQFPIRGKNFTQRMFAVMGNRMFPQFFVTFQWVFLFFGVMSFLNFPVIIPGSKADGELKVIMTSHLWVPLFSTASCFLFYKHRHRGVAEKSIFVASIAATSFSTAHFILRFLNDFLLVMWTTEFMAWIFYLFTFAISVYTVLGAFLASVLGRVMRVEGNSS